MNKRSKTIKASTLSVILKGSDSVHCYLEVNGESCNVSLRFDRGQRAIICGYPQDWYVHDVEVEQYNCESPVGREAYECDALPSGAVYIDAVLEANILRKLKRCVSKQFMDPFWKDYSTPNARQKKSILAKIERAVQRLTKEASRE